MSGAKRRTKYRKHVETDVLEGLPEPGEGEQIVQVVGSRGGNMLEVRSPANENALCLLPSKFRKLVWVKRGNYMIATYSGENYETAKKGEQGKVKYTVKHILFKDQIKHLKKEGLWPKEFEEEVVEDIIVPDVAAAKQTEDGGDEDDDSDLFVNRNKQPMWDEESSSEEDDE